MTLSRWAPIWRAVASREACSLRTPSPAAQDPRTPSPRDKRLRSNAASVFWRSCSASSNARMRALRSRSVILAWASISSRSRSVRAACCAGAERDAAVRKCVFRGAAVERYAWRKLRKSLCRRAMSEFCGAKGQSVSSGWPSAGRNGNRPSTHYPVCFFEELVGRVEAERLCGGSLMALEEGVERRSQVGHVGTMVGLSREEERVWLSMTEPELYRSLCGLQLVRGLAVLRWLMVAERRVRHAGPTRTLLRPVLRLTPFQRSAECANRDRCLGS
jgi:hypothetical protein